MVLNFLSVWNLKLELEPQINAKKVKCNKLPSPKTSAEGPFLPGPSLNHL